MQAKGMPPTSRTMHSREKKGDMTEKQEVRPVVRWVLLNREDVCIGFQS